MCGGVSVNVYKVREVQQDKAYHTYLGSLLTHSTQFISYPQNWVEAM